MLIKKDKIPGIACRVAASSNQALQRTRKLAAELARSAYGVTGTILAEMGHYKYSKR